MSAYIHYAPALSPARSPLIRRRRNIEIAVQLAEAMREEWDRPVVWGSRTCSQRFALGILPGLPYSLLALDTGIVCHMRYPDYISGDRQSRKTG